MKIIIFALIFITCFVGITSLNNITIYNYKEISGPYSTVSSYNNFHNEKLSLKKNISDNINEFEEDYISIVNPYPFENNFDLTLDLSIQNIALEVKRTDFSIEIRSLPYLAYLNDSEIITCSCLVASYATSTIEPIQILGEYYTNEDTREGIIIDSAYFVPKLFSQQNQLSNNPVNYIIQLTSLTLKAGKNTLLWKENILKDLSLNELKIQEFKYFDYLRGYCTTKELKDSFKSNFNANCISVVLKLNKDINMSLSLSLIKGKTQKKSDELIGPLAKSGYIFVSASEISASSYIANSAINFNEFIKITDIPFVSIGNVAEVGVILAANTNIDDLQIKNFYISSKLNLKSKGINAVQTKQGCIKNNCNITFIKSNNFLSFNTIDFCSKFYTDSQIDKIAYLIYQRNAKSCIYL